MSRTPVAARTSGRRSVGTRRAPGAKSLRSRFQSRGPAGPESTAYIAASTPSTLATSGSLCGTVGTAPPRPADSAGHNRELMLTDALTIFLSALLLFLVEPLVGKAVLPWFGG